MDSSVGFAFEMVPGDSIRLVAGMCFVIAGVKGSVEVVFGGRDSFSRYRLSFVGFLASVAL